MKEKSSTFLTFVLIEIVKTVKNESDLKSFIDRISDVTKE